MLETEANSGNYEMTTATSWPTEGYVFNTTLSKCENGSELSWDDTNKKVLMSGNVSDKCYVYFDIYVPPTIADFCSSGDTLATCVKNFGDQGSDISNIYIHNSSLANGAGDNSYRYAGAIDALNNYVCFGSSTAPCPDDNLYRIIGVFGDKVKIIKSTSVVNKAWDSNGSYTWSASSLNSYLNNGFINTFDETAKGKIDTTTWKVGGNTYANIGRQPAKTAYQNEIVNPVTTNSTDNKTEYSAKIGLMYASDYGFAAAPSAWTANLDGYNGAAIKSVNWMYKELGEWTVSRFADDASNVFLVNDSGHVSYNLAYRIIAVRPVFNLTSSVNYVSGSGSSTDPVLIS